MRGKLLRMFCSVILVFLSGVSCASAQKRDIESELVAAMIKKCKTVEIKVDRDREVYLIDPTQSLSENGCPIALIRGWRDGAIIKVKEVEICECRDRFTK